LSTFPGALLARFPVLSIKDLDVVDSKRDLEV